MTPFGAPCTLRFGFAFAVVLLSWLAACHRAPPVAELIAETGAVGRDFSAKPLLWSPASKGDSFTFGDGVKTEKGASAQLRLAHGAILQVNEDTVLHFLTDAPAGGRVRLETGIAEIEMGQGALDFETQFGAAHVEPGARVRVTAGAGTTGVQVLVGSAVMEPSGGGAQERIQTGEQHTFASGGPVRVPSPAPAPDASAEVLELGPDDANALSVRPESAGVQRQRAGSAGLEPLAAGAAAAVEPGTRLVVPAGARVRVRRGAEQATVVGAADVRVGAASGALVEAVKGRITVEGLVTLTRFDVPGGSITVRGSEAAPASADVSLDRERVDFVNRSGFAELRGRKGSVSFAGRESGWLDDRGLPQKLLAIAEAPLFTVPAGESATVHSVRVPVALRIDAAACGPGAVSIEVARGADRFVPAAHADADSGALVLGLSSGAQTYRVRCADAAGAVSPMIGTLRVVQDSGATRLPRRPARDVLHADGRRYSVLYQTLLPELTLDWPQAPAGASLVLRLHGRDDQTYPLDKPTRTFPSGALPEGTYTFAFESAEDAHTRSLDTTVRVAFDNAAPAAEIQEPADAFSGAEGHVKVAGLALEGANVSVGGTPVPLDGQFRFRADVPLAAETRAIAIRIAHPSRGIHYYLRRMGGT